jgi:hypothetical protein
MPPYSHADIPFKFPPAIQGVLPMCRWLGKLQSSLSSIYPSSFIQRALHAPPAPEQQNAGSVPAGCQLVSALTLKTCHDILGGDLLSHAKKLHDSELYAIECANGVISFFARWGVAAAPLAPAEHGERPLPAGHLA